MDLKTDPYLAVLPSDYPQAAESALSVQQLLKNPFCMCRSLDGEDQDISRYLKEYDTKGRYPMTSNSDSTILCMVEELGVSILPKLFFGSCAAKPRLSCQDLSTGKAGLPPSWFGCSFLSGTLSCRFPTGTGCDGLLSRIAKQSLWKTEPGTSALRRKLQGTVLNTSMPVSNNHYFVLAFYL